MLATIETAVVLGLFNLSGGEIILILALLLILIGARRLPELGRGLGRGILEFRDATKRLVGEVDEEAAEAGRSVGGIYGRPAAQALTPDNQVAELYDPAAFREERQAPKCSRKGLAKMWRGLSRFVRVLLRMPELEA